MNLTSLSKEQKQYVLIGAIVFIALTIIIMFVVKGSLSSVGETKAELADLTDKIESAERSLAKRQLTRLAFAETSAELRNLIKTNPPKRNYYSWATEIIHAKARASGLEVDAIDEETVMDRTAPEDENEIRLAVYSLRISARGGYWQVKNFLKQVERDYPLVRVSGIDLSTGPNSDIHNVQLFVEWPFNLSDITDSWESVIERQQTASPQARAASKEKQQVVKKVPTPPAPRQPHDTALASAAPPQQEISMSEKTKIRRASASQKIKPTSLASSSRSNIPYGVKK